MFIICELFNVFKTELYACCVCECCDDDELNIKCVAWVKSWDGIEQSCEGSSYDWVPKRSINECVSNSFVVDENVFTIYDVEYCVLDDPAMEAFVAAACDDRPPRRHAKTHIAHTSVSAEALQHPPSSPAQQ